MITIILYYCCCLVFVFVVVIVVVVVVLFIYFSVDFNCCKYFCYSIVTLYELEINIVASRAIINYTSQVTSAK